MDIEELERRLSIWDEYQIESKVGNSPPRGEKASTVSKKTLSRNCQVPDQSSSQTQGW